jgi:hypothetical protein
VHKSKIFIVFKHQKDIFYIEKSFNLKQQINEIYSTRIEKEEEEEEEEEE